MIKSLEGQQGILRLLIYLSSVNEVNFQRIVFETDIYDRILRLSLEKLKELGLVKTRIDNSSYPPKNMISLTEKGKKIAEYLKNIEEVLKK
ncbi:MAG: transcriptional regulator [Thermoplasmata archaeon]